jgi:hypothetical protein
MYDVEPDHTQLKLLVKAGLLNPGFSRGKEIPEQDETGLAGRAIDGSQGSETLERLASPMTMEKQMVNQKVCNQRNAGPRALAFAIHLHLRMSAVEA